MEKIIRPTIPEMMFIDETKVVVNVLLVELEVDSKENQLIDILILIPQMI